jgi:hypothetical protein
LFVTHIGTGHVRFHQLLASLSSPTSGHDRSRQSPPGTSRPLLQCLFQKAQCNYSALGSEGLALILSLEHFQDILHAVPATYVLTDSSALCFLLGWRSQGLPKLERYIVRMLALPFQMIIGHVRSSWNVADGLTRMLWRVPSIRPTDVKRAEFIRCPFTPGDIVSPQDIIEALERDPNIVIIKDPHTNKKNVAASRP